MKTLRFLCLLSTLIAVASASNTRGGGRGLELHDDRNEDEKVNSDLSGSSGRGLLSLAQCPYLGATIFFNVQTSILPGTGATICSDANFEAIGNMINTALINAGVAIYSGAIFLAGMCDTPTMDTYSTTGMNGSVRRKLQGGFIWTGGGGCRKCNGDNGDGRYLISTLLSQRIEFQNEFISKSGTMEAAIEAEVSKGLVNFPCMGVNPTVSVNVEVVQLWNLSIQCAGDFITSGFLLI